MKFEKLYDVIMDFHFSFSFRKLVQSFQFGSEIFGKGKEQPTRAKTLTHQASTYQHYISSTDQFKPKRKNIPKWIFPIEYRP